MASPLRSPQVRKWAAALVLSGAGLAGIQRDEGTVTTVYLDPVGIPTVCTGHTSTVTRKDVGRKVSDAFCSELLKHDTRQAQADVRRYVRVQLTQDQFDSLVSFDFNVGAGKFRSSTLLRKLNAGDCHGAAAEFPRWNKAGGRVLPGLVKRRAGERYRFELGCA